jgi:hypothetical protein
MHSFSLNLFTFQDRQSFQKPEMAERERPTAKLMQACDAAPCVTMALRQQPQPLPASLSLAQGPGAAKARAGRRVTAPGALPAMEFRKLDHPSDYVAAYRAQLFGWQPASATDQSTADSDIPYAASPASPRGASDWRPAASLSSADKHKHAQPPLSPAMAVFSRARSNSMAALDALVGTSNVGADLPPLAAQRPPLPAIATPAASSPRGPVTSIDGVKMFTKSPSRSAPLQSTSTTMMVGNARNTACPSPLARSQAGLDSTPRNRQPAGASSKFLPPIACAPLAAAIAFVSPAAARQPVAKNARPPKFPQPPPVLYLVGLVSQLIVVFAYRAKHV